ncbi:PAS-domain containing protein [Phreatobacter aquaticus]|nr:PAS-domain containing protein [Phreatobacter aquaticus]
MRNALAGTPKPLPSTGGSRTDLSTLLAASPVGLAVHDRAGMLVSVNARARTLLGLAPDGMPGVLGFGAGWSGVPGPDGSILQPDGPAGITAESGQPVAGAILAMISADGSRRWLSVDTSLIEASSPDGGLVLSSFTDVTETCRDAALMRERCDQVEATFAELDAYRVAVNDAALIAVTDRRGHFIHVNGLFCKLAGYSRAELIGRHYLVLRSPEMSRAQLSTILRTVRRGTTWRGEICEIAKSGEPYWADTSIVPFRDSDGTIIRFVIVRYDVTARRRAEMLLSEAIEAVPEGFVIYDENDRLAVCNSAYRKAYTQTAPMLVEGVTFEEVLRYGLDHGQYPHAGQTSAEHATWLAGRMGRHRAPSNEALQVLPNGRWMQVREQRTQSGLSVGFRTDVTELVRQKELLLAVLDNFPGGISYIDHRLVIRHYNAKFKELLGFPDELFAKEEVTLRETFEFNARRGEYGPGDPDELVNQRMALVSLNQPHQFERVRPDGRVIAVHGTPLKGGGFVTSYVDVTEHKALHNELVRASQSASEKAQHLSLTLEHMAQGLVMFDARGELSVFNARYAQLFDLDPAQIHVGMSAIDMLRYRDRSGAFRGDPAERLAEMHRRISSGQEFHTTLTTPAGRHIQSVTAPVPGGGWVSTHEDITDRMAALQRINHAAHHDALTGLENRLSLKGQIAEAIKRADHTHEAFSVMMVDLDRFKTVNDTYGHALGDEVLKQVATRMRSCVRDNDIVARLGGDEFAILYRVAPNQLADSMAIGRRLLDQISAPYVIEGKQLIIGASIGVAIAPDHGTSTDELMRNADAALYRVKAEGRNALRVFDNELDAIVQARRMLEADLRSALSLGQFELFYQPVVDLQSGAVRSVEALLRWRHPVRGMVGPAEFIPLLEESGLINPVGDWVIEQACRDAVAMPGEVRVAVNVSPVQLRNRSLLGVVSPVLARTGLDPRRLDLEVTESILLERDAALLDDLRKLRDLGTQIVLDDFGTGYSSLSYIRMFPFDKLKIDKTFVDDLGRSDEADAVICAVIGLTKSLEIVSTAEGIETEDQAILLRAAGCMLGQGYLFGRPVPLAELCFEPRDVIRAA